MFIVDSVLGYIAEHVPYIGTNIRSPRRWWWVILDRHDQLAQTVGWDFSPEKKIENREKIKTNWELTNLAGAINLFGSQQKL